MPKKQRKPIEESAPEPIAPTATDLAPWLHFDGSVILSGEKQKPEPIGWEMGHPVYEVWADALVCGDYTHPVTKQKFSLNRAQLDTAANTLGKMLSAGIDCPVVEDHKEQASKSLGWIKGATRTGDTLRLKHHLVGDDALLKAARNKVSVKLVSNFRDSHDRAYPMAITHSSLTPIPVIHSQGGFSIAASGAQTANTTGDAPANVFVLSAANTTRSIDMDFSKEQIERIHKLPGASDATGDDLADFLLSYAETAGANLVTLAADKATLLSRAETAEGNALELSRASSATTVAAPVIDLEALADRADLTLSRIDLLVERGDMPKAQADKVRAKVKRADGTANAVMLSRSDAFESRPVEFILSLFDGSKLGQPSGEKTGTQTLSRETPGADGTPADANPLLELANKMAAKGLKS